MKIKAITAALLALCMVASTGAQAWSYGEFVEEHPWWVAGGGAALAVGTSGIPQIFGVLGVLGGVSHGLKPQIKAATESLKSASDSRHSVDESKIALCNGEVFIPEDNLTLRSKVLGQGKQKRAENLSKGLKLSCQTPSADGVGYVGTFSTSWDESTEVMTTICAYPNSSFPRQVNISFAGDYAQWRTVPVRCTHPVTLHEEAESMKKFGPSILD